MAAAEITDIRKLSFIDASYYAIHTNKLLQATSTIDYFLVVYWYLVTFAGAAIQYNTLSFHFMMSFIIYTTPIALMMTPRRHYHACQYERLQRSKSFCVQAIYTPRLMLLRAHILFYAPRPKDAVRQQMPLQAMYLHIFACAHGHAASHWDIFILFYRQISLYSHTAHWLRRERVYI